MRIFYDHLVEVYIGDLIVKIEEFDISNEERDHLTGIIDNILHHRLMHLILSGLEREDQEIFLASFTVCPHNIGIMEFLKEKSPDIEDEINSEVEDLKNEVLFEVLQS